jgi:DNA-binding Lrp family transcriptional regulator
MPVGAYILFKVSAGKEKEALRKIADLPEAQTVGIVYGEYDLIAKITVSTLHALEDFMAEKNNKSPQHYPNIHDGPSPRIQRKDPTHKKMNQFFHNAMP